MVEPKPTEETDDFGTSRYFTKSVTFKQKVKVLDNQPFTVTGKLEGQACTDGRCVPVEKKFSFDIKGFDKITVNENAVAEETEVAEETPEAPATAEIQPAKDAADEAKAEEEEESLLGYFLGAVFGGLIGLLMPCVFPMIPMTVSFFSKMVTAANVTHCCMVSSSS